MVQANQDFYEYYVPLKLPNQVYPASDFSRLLVFIGFYDNTLVEIDKDNDGTFEVSLTLNRGDGFITGNHSTGPIGPMDFELGTYIRTSKPVTLRYHHMNNDYGIYDDLMTNLFILPTSIWGKQFGIPMSGLGVNAVASTDNTTVGIDENWDGTFENTYALNAGDVIQMGSVPAGSYIESNNPIYVAVYNYSSNKDNFWTYEVLPFSLQGKEYLTTEPGQSYSQISIMGTFDGSTVSIDKDNDDIFDLVQTINKGEILNVTNFSAATRIVSDKKICCVYKKDHFEAGRHFTWAYPLFPIDHEKISFFTDFELGVVPYSPNKVLFTSVTNNNTVSIDHYDNGTVDYTNALNFRGTWSVDCPEPTNISATNPVLVSSFNNTTGFNLETTDGHIHYPMSLGFYEPLPIESFINIEPSTLNKKSKGKWITCYIGLPEGNDVNDIDISTVELEYDSQKINAEWGKVQVDILKVKFNRQDLINILGIVTGYVELKVTGKVADTSFEGANTIRVK
jgi:hypothetical protein